MNAGLFDKPQLVRHIIPRSLWLTITMMLFSLQRRGLIACYVKVMHYGRVMSTSNALLLSHLNAIDLKRILGQTPSFLGHGLIPETSQPRSSVPRAQVLFTSMVIRLGRLPMGLASWGRKKCTARFCLRLKMR